MHTLRDVATALRAIKVGSYYMAHCPTHNDRSPSLKLAETNGKLLVHDFGGCPQEKVITELRSRGLWPENVSRYPSAWGEIVQTFDYTDERGQLLYQICRFEPKSFRPRRPNRTSDGWTWGYGDVRRVLYRLPEVLEARVVFVPEGEKDVESLRTHGFIATTNAGGANGWLEEFNVFFAGREVIILPDNDAPGWNRALEIARGVLPFASRVVLLKLAGAKDVSDWFALGRSELELLNELGDFHAEV